MDHASTVDTGLREHTTGQVATPERRAGEARAGAASAIPLLVGLLPFGLVVGTRVADGDAVAARWLSTVLIMGGSAQLTVFEMVDRGAPIVLVVCEDITLIPAK